MANTVNQAYLLENNTIIKTMFCFRLDRLMINSPGILDDRKNPDNFLEYSLPRLELQIGLICFVYLGLHFVLKHFGLTRFVSAIIAGILLGPTLLGRSEFLRQVIFPPDSQELISTAALLGFQIFLFLITLKLDCNRILQARKVELFSGIAVVIFPLLLGLSFVYINLKNLKLSGTLFEAIIVVIMQCLTTVSVIYHVLDEVKLANSEIGRLALSSALIGDMLGIVIISATVTFLVSSSTKDVLVGVSAIACYILAAVFIFRPVVTRMMRKTSQGSPVSPTLIHFIMFVVISSEIYFKVFRQAQCIGPIVLGLTIPAGSPLRSALLDKFEALIIGVLMPVAVATSVMRADLTLIALNFPRIRFYVALISLPFLVKLITCLIPSLYWKIPLADSMVFSVIMTSRGMMELAAYIVARDVGVIGEDVFAILILCLLINSIIVGVVVKFLYDPSKKYAGYQARNIMSLKSKSEIRILACIYRPENVTSTIRLLDSFYPNTDKPLDVYVLHLIQLIGPKYTPILISHQNQKSIDDNSSHNVIISFNQYKQSNWNSVSVSAFTAISPFKSMNEDISILALDKLVSLILLPLHRRWSIHGKIAADDNCIRNINSRVLDKAPCSVAIFFDRGKLGRRASLAIPGPSLSICVIFLGGNDDREALSLAKRIANDSQASLTILHFLPQYVRMIDSEDGKIDSWTLEGIKKNSCNNGGFENITYKEKMVIDGPQTAMEIHSMADEYDLLIVGRRYGVESPQTAGLSEWTEIPELGIVGDLLASKDTNTRAAVLVVQQQRQK